MAGAATTWYFAEGSSARLERESLAFLNPGARPAYVVTTLVRADGRHVYAVTDIPAHGRATLDAGEAAGLGGLLAAVVRSSAPIYAERTIYHASAIEEGTGAALTAGLRASATRWYLPHPRTRADEREQIAILNPGDQPVTVSVSLVRGGRLRAWRTLVVPALAVRGLQVPGAASAVVTAQGAGVVVEERSLYGNDRGYSIHAGLTALSIECYLLAPGTDGSTGYIMLLNPGTVAAHVTLTGPGFATAQRASVRAGGEELMRVSGWQTAGALHLTADRPVAAAYVAYLPPGSERSLAKDYRGSASAPLAMPDRLHAFAEGDTRLLLSGPQETLLLVNPGPTSARAEVTLLGTDGRTVAQPVDLPAGGAATVAINGWGPPGQHGLLVTADRPILAARGIDFNEGFDALLSAGISP